MDSFPAAISLTGRTVFVCGSGLMADAKLRLFARSPCHLIRYAGEDATALPADLAKVCETRAGWPQRRDWRQADLVFLAGENADQVSRMARAARRAGALVNVVDAPGQSDFQTPAIVDRGSVVVGISTGGAAPVLAVDLRAAIEALLPARLGVLADVARSLRGAVRRSIRGIEARRRFWERVLRGPARERALAGDTAGARRLMLKQLNSPEPVRTGLVSLVGAGPGDPDLLTRKAARCLREADVVVHDRLVSEDVLALARRDAERIDVGKRKGRHPVPQEQIAAILIEQARLGRRVVRLKGGDPFIFGRGGEEIDALGAAGIRVEIVPGISAAIACAASAGIPLTQRGESSSVSFVTGAVRDGGEMPDLRRFCDAAQTVVFYMGAGSADRIASELMAAGRDPATPVAIIENGSRPDQRVIAGSLGALGALAAEADIRGPAVIMVGEPARRARSQPALAGAGLVILPGGVTLAGSQAVSFG
jgi:uroporphyrin-III C-methyltransferase / precorrin-2 dehydrogenase / sirohydrochlorin ferrochelatase